MPQQQKYRNFQDLENVLPYPKFCAFDKYWLFFTGKVIYKPGDPAPPTS